jgi:hypothetical protein
MAVQTGRQCNKGARNMIDPHASCQPRPQRSGNAVVVPGDQAAPTALR